MPRVLNETVAADVINTRLTLEFFGFIVVFLAKLENVSHRLQSLRKLKNLKVHREFVGAEKRRNPLVKLLVCKWNTQVLRSVSAC